jgi:SsrA-binding protein
MAKKATKPEDQGDRLVARNRRASFEYELGETLEAGLVLLGSEVRSLRMHGPGLTEAWVELDHRGEAWVKGMRIPPLVHAAFGHEEKRTRKLLLHAEQILRLQAEVAREGMTLIVTKCYFKNNRAKLEFAVARGKKSYDKRHSIKERESKREASQAMRRGRDG